MKIFEAQEKRLKYITINYYSFFERDVLCAKNPMGPIKVNGTRKLH